MPQKECGKRSSITFFRFRDTFGHFSVTFSDSAVTFFVTFLPDSFCWTPFAAGWTQVQKVNDSESVDLGIGGLGVEQRSWIERIVSEPWQPHPLFLSPLTQPRSLVTAKYSRCAFQPAKNWLPHPPFHTFHTTPHNPSPQLLDRPLPPPPSLWLPGVSHKSTSPREKRKQPKSSSKVGFGATLEMGKKEN